MPDYKLKLKALLHDPIDKQYVMWELKEKHEEVAQKYFNYIYSESIEEKDIKIADSLASAISRVIVASTDKDLKEKLEEELKFEWEEVKYIDIFSLKSEDAGKPSFPNEVKEFLEKLGDLIFEDENKRAELCFLFLWRFLPEIFPWINIHPADSRAPNHSIYDHLVQTSAIVSCLPKPAFLLFTIGPVQEHIATARKTSDLWAGSYILSYLIYKAIEVILEKLGPDNIIYPNLLRQPLIDRWLYNKFKATDIEEKLKEQPWFKEFIDNTYSDEKLAVANFPNRFLAIVPFDEARDIAEECKRRIEKEFSKFTDNLRTLEGLKEMSSDTKDKIENDLKSYFQIYYIYLPWFNSNYQDVQTISDEYKELVGESRAYEVVETIKKLPFYEPNVGNAYSLLCELSERFLASRKMYRVGKSKDQRKEKCHLCGNYEVLDIKWEELKGIIKERERLCGVCFIKRLFPMIIKNLLNLQKEIRFPSTYEMATTLYKLKMKKEDIEKFKEKFKKIENEIPRSRGVPALKEHSLYEIDGHWLFLENYRKEYLEREYGIDISEDELKEIIEVVREFKDVPAYYAILMMDGDEMGKWLKGEKMAKIGDLIHPKVKKLLLEHTNEKDREVINKLFCLPHPLSASLHQSFSRRLTDFALNTVIRIVEKENYGKLIYAGGDDILAFLPVENSLKCAFNLQKEFSEIFGGRASMSAGIVIVHCKYPLSLALKKVREAERKAKDIYGRNAFCVIYLARGGEERFFGGKWETKDFFDNMVGWFKNQEISKGFGFEFLESVEKLGGGMEILKLELKRILRRKFKIKQEDKKQEIEKEFLKVFDGYQNNLKDFANMIIIGERIT